MREMEAGHELDALVAEKVMGSQVTQDSVTGWWVEEPDGVNLRRYSTDISAAWEAAEAVMGRTRWRFQCGYAYGLSGRPRWYAFFGDPSEAYGAANTAPLAICLAALKAVEAP